MGAFDSLDSIRGRIQAEEDAAAQLKAGVIQLIADFVEKDRPDARDFCDRMAELGVKPVRESYRTVSDPELEFIDNSEGLTYGHFPEAGYHVMSLSLGDMPLFVCLDGTVWVPKDQTLSGDSSIWMEPGYAFFRAGAWYYSKNANEYQGRERQLEEFRNRRLELMEWALRWTLEHPYHNFYKHPYYIDPNARD